MNNIKDKCINVTTVYPNSVYATLYDTIDTWVFTIITPEDYE